MNVRPATLGDMESLLTLQAEIHDLHVRAEPHRYRPAPQRIIRERFSALLQDDDTQILVAQDGPDILGYLVASHEHREGHPLVVPRAFVLVDALCVSAKARRRGVGRQLMEAAQAHADALGAEGVELTVRAFNAEAVAFYEALGFVPEQLRMSRACSPGAPTR